MGELAVNLVNPVKSVFTALTKKRVKSIAQVRTIDGAVKVDRTYEIDGKVNILWEDKAIPVFDHHLNDLMTRLAAGEKLFPEIRSPESTKLSRQGAEAILAKATVLSCSTIHVAQ